MQPGLSPDAAAQALLGHRFARPALLAEALTHRSAAPSGRGRRGRPAGAGSNERLEFLGDRVLGLLVAEWLTERFPEEQEGGLGRRLAALVSQPVLAEVAERIGLPEALSVSPGEARAGVKRRATVLADALEAAIGALFLDGGLDPARRFIRQAFAAAMEGQAAPPKDAKTALQEWAQRRGHDLPAYRLAAQSGPSHAPVFTIAVTVAGQTGTGQAGAKRAAEQLAASALLALLEPETSP
ncbi:MAG: ribonuclease III [Rhodospirillales bacterium]|nr:ribonuclease III [Rhodospirillales bacterium]